MGDSEFGLRLKKAREDAHLTQASVCNTLGIPKTQTLSAYERGVNCPPLKMLKALAVLYGVSTDSLLFGKSNIPQKEKTKEDYVRQLVEAVDNLKLPLQSLADSFLHTTICEIVISDSCYTGLDLFAEKWVRLRDLLDNETIEPSEYEELITQRLNNLSLEERT